MADKLFNGIGISGLRPMMFFPTLSRVHEA